MTSTDSGASNITCFDHLTRFNATTISRTELWLETGRVLTI